MVARVFDTLVGVRLALVGPCDGDVAALSRAVATAIEQLHADHVVYLGTDDALDTVIEGWMSVLAVESSLMARASAVLDADASAIARTIEAEKQRRRLQCVHALAGPGVRSIELMHERIVLMIDDKATLDEEDLLPATVIAFGRGTATIRRVGSRIFVAPGLCAARTEGLLLIDEEVEAGVIGISLCDVAGVVTMRESFDTTRSAKMKVQSG